jgi:serine/threonine protein phosphatase PrpC
MEDRHRVHYGTPPFLLTHYYNHFYAPRASEGAVADHERDRALLSQLYPYRALVGVFDGHGGEESAHYACKNLHKILCECIRYQLRQKQLEKQKERELNKASEKEKQYEEQKELANPLPSPSDFLSNESNLMPSLYPPASSSPPSEPSLYSYIDYPQALRLSFDYLEACTLALSCEVGFRDGTTVNCCVIDDRNIYCANTGDSRAVLCRGGKAEALSTDHRPHQSSEKQRIITAGGQVRAVMAEKQSLCCWGTKNVPQGAERLWPGGFSVSRAVGDIDYKDLRRRKCKVVHCLIHHPDITTTRICERCEFIISATDGLWDIMSPQQACDYVWKCLKRPECHPLDMARLLIERAFELGGEDNITVLITYFNTNDLSHQGKRRPWKKKK